MNNGNPDFLKRKCIRIEKAGIPLNGVKCELLLYILSSFI